jgi:hypothetical protein
MISTHYYPLPRKENPYQRAAKNIKDYETCEEDALRKLYETKSGFMDSVKLKDLKKILM